MAEANGSGGGSARATAISAIQALGRGFDVTSDIRLLYCKGSTGTRLLKIDEDYCRDLNFPDHLCIPNVPSGIIVKTETSRRYSTGILDFDQMSELFNRNSGLPGKVPLGKFNTMFSFSGSWQVDSLQTKSLAVDGWIIPLYSVYVKPPFILCDEVKNSVPTTWDPMALANFIEKYGTHVIINVEVGGKDAVYVKQHQSSPLTKAEMETHVKKLVEARFGDNLRSRTNLEDKQIKEQRNQLSQNDGTASHAGIEDITVIYRRRGGNDLIQDHTEWKRTVKSNPDVISMRFLSIDMLLESVPAKENLGRAIEAYLTYKPPLEELQYFFEFRVPRSWAPVVNQVGLTRKEPVCPSLQFSLMGPKLFINLEQVSVGRKPVTGLRLSLEGSKLNRLAIHLQHLTVLPKILQPHWNPYVPIGAPKWHGPEEQDCRWFEPVLWKNYAHVSTAPVEYSETWFGEASGAYIVTGAQLGVWDFGSKSVLHLKLLYSKVPGCIIRRSVWDHTPDPSREQMPKSSKATMVTNSTAEAQATQSSQVTQAAQKLSKLIDTAELMRGPEHLPGHWLVSGAKLCVEKNKIFLRAKYSLLNY